MTAWKSKYFYYRCILYSFVILQEIKNMIPEGPLFHKPKAFVSAKNLLYASIFVGVINILLSYFFAFSNSAYEVPALIVSFVILVVIFLLVKEMSFCKKWARTLLLVLFILVMIGFPFMLIDLFKTNMLLAALAVLEVSLQLIALVFLYTTDCNKWFNSTTSEERLA